MNIKSNKLIIRRFFSEILVDGNPDLFERIIHPKYSAHHKRSLFFENRSLFSSKLDLEQKLMAWVKSFDFELLKLDLIGEDNDIIAMIQARITQIQKWNELENKNQSSVIDSVRWFTFKENQIISMTTYNDYYKFWHDLGHGSKLNVHPDSVHNDYLELVKELALDF